MKTNHATFGRRLFLAACAAALGIGVYAASLGGQAVDAPPRPLCQNSVPAGHEYALNGAAQPERPRSTGAATAE